MAGSSSVGAASASRKTWNWRAKLTHEKTKPGRTCSCLALETRLEFHPASEGIEVHVNKGEVCICKDGVVMSDSNLHVSFSAKLLVFHRRHWVSVQALEYI